MCPRILFRKWKHSWLSRREVCKPHTNHTPSGQSKRELLKLHRRAWRHVHILTHRKLREEDHWVPATLGWIVRPWLKKTNKQTHKQDNTKKLQQQKKTLTLANLNIFLESIYKWPGTKNRRTHEHNTESILIKEMHSEGTVRWLSGKNAFSTTLVTWFPSDIKAEGENRPHKIVLRAPRMLCAHSHPHLTHSNKHNDTLLHAH